MYYVLRSIILPKDCADLTKIIIYHGKGIIHIIKAEDEMTVLGSVLYFDCLVFVEFEYIAIR